MNSELLLPIGVILNAVFLGILFFMRRRMAVVGQWLSTMGTVVNSYLERRSSSNGSTNYPVVQYSYQVGGRAYQNTKTLARTRDWRHGRGQGGGALPGILPFVIWGAGR
jgi:hypothetical protein